MKQWIQTLAIIATITLATVTTHAANATTDTARQIVKQYQKAVINVTAVVKINAMGDLAGMMPEQEQKIQLIATVIDESGLAICSLMQLDPGKAMGERTVQVGGVRKVLKLKTDLAELKYRLADGTEVNGKIVFKDEDLDFAFIAPEEPLDDDAKAEISHVDLKNTSDKVALMDELIIISRTGKELSYTTTVLLKRVVGIVTKPRKFYLLEAMPGRPLFNTQGELIGIGLLKRGPKKSSGNPAQGPQASPIIVPIKQIAKLVPQAKEEMKKLNQEKADEATADDTTDNSIE